MQRFLSFAQSITRLSFFLCLLHPSYTTHAHTSLSHTQRENTAEEMHGLTAALADPPHTHSLLALSSLHNTVLVFCVACLWLCSQHLLIFCAATAHSLSVYIVFSYYFLFFKPVLSFVWLYLIYTGISYSQISWMSLCLIYLLLLHAKNNFTPFLLTLYHTVKYKNWIVGSKIGYEIFFKENENQVFKIHLLLRLKNSKKKLNEVIEI